MKIKKDPKKLIKIFGSFPLFSDIGSNPYIIRHSQVMF